MPISSTLNATNASLLGTIKKHYPSLNEQRIDRLFDKVNDTLFQRGVINCSHKGIRGVIGGADFFEYLLKAVVNWSDSGQVAGELKPGLVKEINDSLTQRDVHFRDRAKHQRRRDQTRFNILLYAADQIRTGANNHSIIAAAGLTMTGKQDAKTGMNKLVDGDDIYDRSLFNRLVQKAFLYANPEVEVRANQKLWREAIEFAKEEARKKKEREEELARQAKRERDQKLSDMLERMIETNANQTRLMSRTHGENLTGRRVEIASAINTFVNSSAIDFNQALTEQSQQLNALLDEVDKVFVKFKNACDEATEQHAKYEKMKQAVAKGLFKAVVNLAPPPLNIAAGAVAGLAKQALDSAGQLEEMVSVFADNVDTQIASVGGSSDVGAQTRSAIEEIKTDTKKAAISYLSTTPPPTAGSIVNQSSLKNLLKLQSENAKEKTKETFRAVVGELGKKTDGETWGAFFQRRLGAVNADLAGIDLMEGMSAAQLRGLSQTDMLLRSNTAIGTKTESIISDFYKKLDNDLNNGWAPFVNKIALVERYFELYFWAMYCAQHFITGATTQRGPGGMVGASVTLPNLGDACIQRLQELGFVDTTSGRFVTPYMGGNNVTSVTYRGTKHRGDRFMIYFTLGGWAMAGPEYSPFNLIFENSSAKAMSGKIESCLTDHARAAVKLREDVRRGTSVVNLRMRRDRLYHEKAKLLFQPAMSRK